MAYIILDAVGWQNVVDFETGESLDSWDNPVVDDMMKLVPHFQYPGDTEPDSIEWTANIGKALYEYNQPDFMFLSFATPGFIKSSYKLDDSEEKEIHERLFSSIKDFLDHTGYSPVIIGTGGMSELKEIIIPNSLKGRISQGHGPFSHSGIFRVTEEEAKLVRDIKHTRMYTNEEMRKDFPEASDEYFSQMPDILITRESGYAFSRARYRGMFQYKAPEVTENLPIHTTLQMPSHLTDVKRVINEALDNKQKVALIVLDGVGAKDFLLPYDDLPAHEKWLSYSDTFCIYMALLLGEPFYRFGIPLVREIKTFVKRGKRYPYSQFTDGDMPKNTIGRRKDIKTAAAGSRSIYTHAISQADICIECQARQMVASGTLVLVNDPK